MRILITGCSGFIGRRVAELALKRGMEVSGIDLRECPVKGVEFAKGDILRKEDAGKAARGADAVMHLAAEPMTAFDRDLRGCYDVNVTGFMNVIEAARAEGCGKFAYASSSAVYESGDHFSEAKPIDFRKLKSHYAKSKLMDEMIADSYSYKYGLKTMGFRIFNAYGPNEKPERDIISMFMDYKQRHEKLKIYGDGKQARDFVYVDDVAEMMLGLMDKGTHDIYNIGTGIATSYNEIADMIDGKNKVYVPNPLPSYLYLTRADTKRLSDALGRYNFLKVKDKVGEMMKARNI